VTRYAISLGSNLGDRLGHLTSAVGEIGEIVEWHSMSSLYETEPVGGPDQGPFLNAVAMVGTSLGPIELLDRLQEIELRHGRERAVRWGPRTLDLDIVATDGALHRDERLAIPHPRAAERAFVLRPLAELWPDAMVADGKTAADALVSLGDEGVDKLASKWVPPVASQVPALLVLGQFALLLVAGLAFVVDGRLPEGGVKPATVLGAIAATVGLVLMIVASRSLGSAMTPNPVPRAGTDLVITGPYRLARHPVYGGLILVFLGVALFLESWWGLAVAALLIPYLWMKSSYEERHLRMRFAGYQAYRAAVRRRLIPFVI
jgi:2-amino-4-hydroxy-6-hydroxymethyldihydropteridine diphosphokinase